MATATRTRRCADPVRSYLSLSFGQCVACLGPVAVKIQGTALSLGVIRLPTAQKRCSQEPGMHTLRAYSICHPCFGLGHGEEPVQKHLALERSSINFATPAQNWQVNSKRSVSLKIVSANKVLWSNLPLTRGFFSQEPRADLIPNIFTFPHLTFCPIIKSIFA